MAERGSPGASLQLAGQADFWHPQEAFSLLAMSAGLGTSVLGGQSSPGQAQVVIDYHLHRLFPASRPALRQAPAKTARILKEG